MGSSFQQGFELLSYHVGGEEEDISYTFNAFPISGIEGDIVLADLLLPVFTVFDSSQDEIVVAGFHSVSFL